MPERFYAPHLSDEAAVRLEGAEAHHLSRVLRLNAGDAVELFDGAGHAADAEITAISRSNVELAIVRRHQETPDAGPVVDLSTAVPKSDRFRWLVEKATELGVRRLLPLRTARSVVEPGAGKLDKMRQTVISACKQSGRNRLMDVEPPCDWNELISHEFAGKTVLVADPAGESLHVVLQDISAGNGLLLVIGPEGGLTTTEVEQAAAAGGKLVSLGANLLRIETAAVALAAACRLSVTNR